MRHFLFFTRQIPVEGFSNCWRTKCRGHRAINITADDSGTYGSATLIPQITVNTSGFIDSIGTVAVASISSTTWDSSTGEYTISTADGGSFKTAIRGFGDNVSLAFGNENDAIISRNPTNLVIKDSTGGIYIEAQDIYLASKNNGNPIWLQVGADDGVKLNDSTGNLILKTREIKKKYSAVQKYKVFSTSSKNTLKFPVRISENSWVIKWFIQI